MAGARRPALGTRHRHIDKLDYPVGHRWPVSYITFPLFLVVPRQSDAGCKVNSDDLLGCESGFERGHRSGLPATKLLSPVAKALASGAGRAIQLRMKSSPRPHASHSAATVYLGFAALTAVRLTMSGAPPVKERPTK